MNKKSCYGCRALQEHYDSAGVIYYSCRLGYEIREDEIRHEDYKEHRPVPTEDCPKPRTWRILYNLPNKASSGRGGTPPESGEYKIEWVDADTVQLTPRR